jgi:thymidylate synthase
LKYFAAEMIWYLSGDRSIHWIRHYSKFWEKLVNEEGLINSNYGNLIMGKNEHGNSAWTWCYDSLIQDEHTRQAVLHFNNPSHREWSTRDFPCTMYGIFSIREDKLDFTVQMRSSDVVKGITFDIPFFSTLLQSMWILIKRQRPHIELGNLYFSTNSLHAYESDWPLIDSMLSSGVNLEICVIKQPVIDENGIANPLLIDQYEKPLDSVMDSLESWMFIKNRE